MTAPASGKGLFRLMEYQSEYFTERSFIIFSRRKHSAQPKRDVLDLHRYAELVSYTGHGR